MTLGTALQQSTLHLKKNGIATARLDSLILLEEACGRDKAFLLAHPEHELTPKQNTKLQEQIERRSKHEPLAYIRGKTEFYGREFLVNAHTLEPRPETETMIELALQVICDGHEVMDIGTGSGAIAITIKLERPSTHVSAIDIDPKCLDIARKNAVKHDVDITFYQGSLLEPCTKYQILDTKNFTILANLPYVPDSHTINQAAMFEPKHAIFGGADGLGLYREMFKQISGMQVKPSFIFTESLPFQHDILASIAKVAGHSLEKTEDFIQVFNRL